jgi:hypothetical protein
MPERPAPKDVLHNFKTYLQVRRVADFFFTYLDTDVHGTGKKPRVVDMRQQGPRREQWRQSLGQTHQGILVELSYDNIPHALYTPWGKWEIARRYSGQLTDDERDGLLKRLGATLFAEAVLTEVGYFGRVYALHRLGEEVLPNPVARPPARDFKPLSEAWKQMTKQYEKQRQKLQQVRVAREGQQYTLDELSDIT